MRYDDMEEDEKEVNKKLKLEIKQKSENVGNKG